MKQSNLAAAAFGGLFGGLFFGYCLEGMALVVLGYGIFGMICGIACEE